MNALRGASLALMVLDAPSPLRAREIPQPRRSPKRRCAGFRTPCDEGLRPYMLDGHIEACKRAGRHRCRSRDVLPDEVWCMDCYTLAK